MEVCAPILKWQLLRARAKKTQVFKIYSDPGSGLVTVDGSVGRWYWWLPWANVHDGPGVVASPAGTVMSAGFLSSAWPSPIAHLWQSLGRSIMTFDLAVLPPGNPIMKAVYKFYVWQVYDQLGVNPAWGLVESHPIAPNNLVPADYQNLDSTIISTVLNYTDVVVGQFNSLEILPAYLSLLEPGTILKLGFREANYDIPNVEPAWGWYWASGIDIYTVDAPSDRWPYLEVTIDP